MGHSSCHLTYGLYLQDCLNQHNCILIKSDAFFTKEEVEKLYENELSKGFSLLFINANGELMVCTPLSSKEISFSLITSVDQIYSEIWDQRKKNLLQNYPLFSLTLPPNRDENSKISLYLLGLNEDLNKLDYSKNMVELDRKAKEITEKIKEKLNECNDELINKAKELGIIITIKSPYEYECRLQSSPDNVVVIKGLGELRGRIHAEIISQWLEKKSIPYTRDEFYKREDPVFTKSFGKDNNKEQGTNDLKINLTSRNLEITYSDPFFHGSSDKPHDSRLERIWLRDSDPLTELEKFMERRIQNPRTLISHLIEIKESLNNSDNLSIYYKSDHYFLEKKMGSNNILRVKLDDFTKTTMENKVKELEELTIKQPKIDEFP